MMVRGTRRFFRPFSRAPRTATGCFALSSVRSPSGHSSRRRLARSRIMDDFVSARSRGKGTQLHNTHTRAHIYIRNCTHARVQGGNFRFQAKLTSLLGGSEIVYVRFSFVRTLEHISKFTEYDEVMFRELIASYIQTGTVMISVFRSAD